MLNLAKIGMAAAAAWMVGAAGATPPPSVFVAKAGAGDLYEKMSSQIVLASTRNPDVRRFATMMVVDHGKSTQMVKSAARRSGLHPQPPALDPAQRRMIADLRRTADGRDRDMAYIEQQKQAHAETLSLMQDYAAKGAAPPLRRVVGDIVPVVRHHIDMLNSIRR